MPTIVPGMPIQLRGPLAPVEYEEYNPAAGSAINAILGMKQPNVPLADSRRRFDQNRQGILAGMPGGGITSRPLDAPKAAGSPKKNVPGGPTPTKKAPMADALAGNVPNPLGGMTGGDRTMMPPVDSNAITSAADIAHAGRDSFPASPNAPRGPMDRTGPIMPPMASAGQNNLSGGAGADTMGAAPPSGNRPGFQPTQIVEPGSLPSRQYGAPGDVVDPRTLQQGMMDDPMRMFMDFMQKRQANGSNGMTGADRGFGMARALLGM